MENDKLTLTVDETAKILGVGRNSAYEAIARGEIPVVKVSLSFSILTPSLLTLVLSGVILLLI